MKKYLLSIICTLLPMIAWAQEPYAIMIDENTAIEFRYDNEKAARGGMDIGPFSSEEERPWNSYVDGIYSVIFDESFANCTTITSTAYWFSWCQYLDYIGGLEYLNTSNVTDMTSMFSASGLKSIDLSHFDTSNVTTMRSLFNGCHSLTSPDLSNFNTSKVTDMWGMFAMCNSCITLDLSSFDTSNVTDMGGMFNHSLGLTTIYVGSGWSTSNVTSSMNMFSQCSALVGESGTTYDSSHTDAEYARIDMASSPGYLTYKNGGSSGQDAQYWMELESTLQYADDVYGRARNNSNVDPWMLEELSEFMNRGSDMLDERTAEEEEVRHMIEEISWICWEIEEAMNRNPDEPGEAEPYAVLSDNNTVLTFYYDNEKSARGGMDVGPFSILSEPREAPYRTNSPWDSERSSITNVVFDASFANCTSITSTALWIYGFDNLTTISGLEYLNTSNVTDMNRMFYGCSSLTNLNLSTFDTSNLINLEATFADCSSLVTIDLSNWRTPNMAHVAWTFGRCPNLKTIYVSEGWSTESLSGEGISMFEGCERLVGGRGTQWSQDHTNAEYAHIDGGVDNPGYLTDKNGGESEAWFDGLTAWVYGDATLDDAFAEVGREEALKTIAAIVWESDNSLTDDLLEDITNPNLLVYCRDRSIAPGGVQNVIINGVAEQIILTDASGNNNFHCPQAFTAKNIGYTRNFSQTTEIGVSRGWETIALPFNVQGIFHELHGALVPFGGGNGGYPIWLHQLQGDGLTPVTAIEANTPYLICMPNNKVYPSAYNQAGNVTFVSSNVTVPETHPHEGSGAGVMLIPAFQNQDSSPDIYTLNVGEARDSYAEGSVFISNYRSVRPFQAYAVHTSQARGEDSCYIPLTSIGGGDGDTTGIMEIENGKLNIESWYSLDGRRLNAKPTKKGVYVNNGRKVVIK